MKDIAAGASWGKIRACSAGIVQLAAVVVAALFVTAAVLYALGLRVVLYGGGSPHLEFVESAN